MSERRVWTSASEENALKMLTKRGESCVSYKNLDQLARTPGVSDCIHTHCS